MLGTLKGEVIAVNTAVNAGTSGLGFAVPSEQAKSVIPQLRDKGNTVLVVEHKPEAIAIGDHVVDLGPRAGTQGGEVVFEGTVEENVAAGGAPDRVAAALLAAACDDVLEVLEPPGGHEVAARPVPGCQRRRLVEKEQFGVAALAHHRPPPPFEIAKAYQPGLERPAAHRMQRFGVGIVDNAAISHEGSARLCCNYDTERRHTVLKCHNCCTA